MQETPAPYYDFTYTSVFLASAKGLLDDEALRQLELTLLENPECGTVETGAGGVRKVRVALEGRGKRGGARVLYFYLKTRGRIYLLLVYPKNAKAALTTAERAALKVLAKRLEAEP